MSHLYPLQIIPDFVERVWGTHDVSFLYQHSVGPQPIGEVWLTGEQCRIGNGPLQGRTIAELSQERGAALIGENARTPNRFPLLLKVLFPREKLSVQVHPDDATAQAVGEPCGKTECWYILKAEPGAQIGLGFVPDTTNEQIEEAIRANRMEHLLNWIDVHEGEMYYVDAGTVHAIAPGAIILETQQNSDTTYRLYDYGRPRELHLEKGLAALKHQTHAGRVEAAGDTLVCSPSFTVSRMNAAQQQTVKTSGLMRCLFAMEGAARIEAPGAQPLTITRGDTVVIPAALDEFTVIPQWNVTLISAGLSEASATEPHTELYCAEQQKA
jgi:mannose-6-phosphate isomerase